MVWIEGFNCLNSIAPTIDYSHNMRILKLPKSTPPGTLIYRLKGSDGDPNTQLSFGVSGSGARALLEILPVPHSWNEADVYLKQPLTNNINNLNNNNNNYNNEAQLIVNSYNLSLYVSDGNLSTQVESTILVTDPDELEPPNSSSSPTSSTQSAFLNTKHIFHVAESLRLDESLGQVNVLESDSNELPVRFELRGRGSERFALKYIFGPRGQSRAELVLAQPIDYEKQNLFSLKLLALNAWTDTKWDTRNVLTMDILISVSDVQDTPPIFGSSNPTSVRLNNAMQVGDLVAQIEAQDGDLADQRPIHFALDASSPISSYLNIDKLSGQISLARSMSELLMEANWDSPGWSLLTVIASEPPDPSSFDHLWPPMYSKLELPLLLVDLHNEEPQFVGGWRKPVEASGNNINVNNRPSTNGHENARPGVHREEEAPPLAAPSGGNAGTLGAYIPELGGRDRDPSGMAVHWYTGAHHGQDSTNARLEHGNLDSIAPHNGGRPLAVDLGLGQNGTFQLTLEGPHAHLFRVEPSLPVTKQTSISLFVADQLAPSNWSLFDRESGQLVQPSFQIDLVARDFGSPKRMASKIACQIDLIDLDDNKPQFESDLYAFSIYENALRGQTVGFVRARDADSTPTSGSSASLSPQVASHQNQQHQAQPYTRIRYGPLTGPNGHLFRVHPESGQISLEGSLDRERESSYLFLLEASDLTGKSNYTRVMISVLDINDNSPIFLQSHYDAVLQSDGTFYQPLVVRALDADEPNTANSQVAYEIIAGNRDEQFVLDSLSGTLYPSGQQPASFVSDPTSQQQQLVPPPLQLPPSISAPIEPFKGSGPLRPAAPGKILPGREIEESTWPPPSTAGMGSSAVARANTKQRKMKQRMDASRVEYDDSVSSSATNSPPARLTDSHLSSANQEQASSGEDSDLMRLESAAAAAEVHAQHTRSLIGTHHQSPGAKMPPIITLIVRAHDFGIPLRSSTVRVNIYNQAQLSRTLSVILNGTAEQIDSRREPIERALSSLTGSRATIESVESLSESSSLCVAHVRMLVPQHNLVDLTDLTALIDAIDYRPHSYPHPYSHVYPPAHESGGHPSRAGSGQSSTSSSGPADKLQPHGPFGGPTPGAITPVAANISQQANNGQLSHFLENTFYHSSTGLTGDPSAAAVERRLLIYIIIVAICILSLLVLWMIYSCSQSSEHRHLL